MDIIPFRIVWQKFTKVSEKCTASIFNLEKYAKDARTKHNIACCLPVQYDAAWITLQH
jgi:hypothetical protein